MDQKLEDRIERAIGRRPIRTEHIGAGAAGRVHRAWFVDGITLVCKSGLEGRSPQAAAGASRPEVEAAMLRYLQGHSSLPVPAVVFADRDVLIMQDMPGRSLFTPPAEEHAAALLAELHAITAPDGRYGLGFTGTIGALLQPNSPREDWVSFFRDQRLLAMAAQADAAGRIPAVLLERITALAASLASLIPARPHCSLLHGDVWGGNVLAERDRITALLDPAVYYGDAEVELAFINLFSTFGDGFFARYTRLRGIEPEFWRTRRHVYNTYPLLVHVTMYGGGYVGQLDETLRSVGF